MKQASEIDKLLQLKMIWAKMIDRGSIGLSPIIEPYEDLLCETFEGCWLHNHWHMPPDDCGEKYELLSGTYNGKKDYYTLVHTIDAYGGKKHQQIKLGQFLLRACIESSDHGCRLNIQILDIQKAQT